jgi:DNA-directed RNA polymerase specialized sigma24 family protein
MAEADLSTLRPLPMNDALLRLFCRERTVFLAMRVDHFSIDEIAERMGLSYDEALRIFIRAFRNSSAIWPARAVIGGAGGSAGRG